jgi:cobalt-zinc-cadmium efflux system protein
MHNHHNTGSRLLYSVLLNALITVLEIAGGIFSNSLALISDAIHNLSDTLALLLAWLANRVGKRRPDARRTYGYKRFEILSAFVNAAALTSISIYLMYVAVLRFIHPEEVKPGLMFFIAVIGLAANMASMLFLHRDAKHNLNVKAAYLHLLGDTLSSVAVIAGAITIYYTGIYWIDPLLTMVISVVIIFQAYRILRESTDILMQTTPVHVNLEEVKRLLEKHPQVKNIHHVHCWQLQDKDVLFEAHVETVNNMSLSESGSLIEDLDKLLKTNFGIQHTTLQVEYDCCKDTAMIKQLW